MRSRTDSESAPTSTPSTRAAPALSGRRPVSILMTVVFPLPLGPRKPKISPFSTRKLTSLTAVKFPKRLSRCSSEISASVGFFAIASISRFQLHVGSHAGKHLAAGIIDANLYAKNLVHAFLAGLHVARQEFSLLIDLFEDPFENSSWKRVDSDFGLLAELEAAVLGFGNVDANVDLIFLQQRSDGRIRCDEVARADVENLDDRGGRGGDPAFAEAGLVVGVSRFGQVHVFAAIPALQFFQVGQRLMVVRFGGGDFLRTVAALKFVELMPGTLLLRDGDFPIGFGGVALLLGDQIFFCECVIAVEIQMSTDFVGLRSIEIGLCGGDVFLAIAILLHLVFGFGLGREGSGFRDLFGAVAAPGFFRLRPGLLEGSLQFFVVKGDQDLARLDRIALADQDLVDAAADFGTDANVAGFDGTGTFEGHVASQPAGTEPSSGQHGRSHEEN